MALRVSWIKNGNTYRRVEGDISNVDVVPKGIYSIDFNPLAGWSLEEVAEEFHFDYKIYGLQSKFVKHVLYAYHHTRGNLGILLNGTKGTGKTVTAKILANDFELPVVIVKSFGENNQGLIEYLSSFNFDCVFFFDEFEKNFNEKDCSILQIMDGVYNSQYRRIFLLTTNETRINENLLSRPSRLRYVKEFCNLEQEVVKEYLNDNLIEKKDIDSVIDFVDTLQISTIDILKTIVEDINIFGYEEFMKNKDFFNVKTAEYCYFVYRTYLDREAAKMYSIDEFLKDVKRKDTSREPVRFMYDTEAEYDKACEKYRKNRPRISMSTLSVDTIKSVKNMHPGDEFGSYDSEVIVSMDLQKKVVIKKDINDDDYLYYYFIKDINAKPSLYAHYNKDAYGYSGPVLAD